MSADILEKVKIELRSILLSSKHGVAAANIRSDYELLTCQRLPLKELGFNDVQALMRAIPDVAKEVRAPSGEISYHAVSDESTAHIQKLVSNQRSKKKTGRVTSWTGRGFSRGRGGRLPREFLLGRGGKLTRGGGSYLGGNRRPFLARTVPDYSIRRPDYAMRRPDYPVRMPPINSAIYRSGLGQIVNDSRKASNSDTLTTENCAACTNDDVSKLTKMFRAIVGRGATESPDMHDSDADISRQKPSPICNLQIGVTQTGRRIISTTGNPLMRNGDAGDPGGQDQFDLRNVLHARHEQSSAVVDELEVASSRGDERSFNTDASNPKRGMIKENRESFHKNLPPRLQRLQQQQHSLFAKERPAWIAEKFPSHFSNENKIMETQEQAQQNAARSFCLKNKVPLLQQSEPPELPCLGQAASQSSSAEQSVSQQSNVEQPASQLKKHRDLPETMEKIYKMLKPNGIWVHLLGKLYEETYGETLRLDFHSVGKQFPDYFTIEQLATNRYTVYPVPGALAWKQLLNNNIGEVMKDDSARTWVPVPISLKPEIGCKLKVLFSFAYSATDLYLQRADMENLVYELDEILNKHCPASSPPGLDEVAVNSLVAANYEESWYRAQVLSMEESVVNVYFIDYGNREKMSLADLRPIPCEQRTLNTPCLAIRCALRKSKEEEWCKNVGHILTELSESDPILTAMILEDTGDQCIVDLYTSQGSLINDMLLQSPSKTPTHSLLLQRTESTEQPDPPQETKTTASNKLFTDDPEPLVIPDSETFAVYVCRVMSENTVLLRIVDSEYSDKLDELEQDIADNFYSWPIPKFVSHSNIYAGMVLARAEDAEDVEYDENGKEQLSDQNKYHRVRVINENEDGSCECYLPDHGHNEVLHRSQLREIDQLLNASLSYQAVMATLHGLDKLPDRLKPMTVRILIKLLTNGSTFYAIKKGKSAEKMADASTGVDVKLINRVRKIISCMRDVQPAIVAEIYESVFFETIENVEEVIKHIPGYGIWKEMLEVDLVDTTTEDDDVNINESVLNAIEAMNKVQSQGGNIEEVWRDLFSSDTSLADTESLTEGIERWVNKLPAEFSDTDSEAKVKLVENYVQQLPRSESHNDSKSAPAKALYTWTAKPEIPGSGVPSCHTPSSTPPPSSQSSVCDISRLPKFWPYPSLKFVSIQITRVENPSDFVAVPMEQRGALEKIEMAIAEYFSVNRPETAANFSPEVLYAVKFSIVYRRALFVGLVGDMVKVFFPDHYFYDTVLASELFLLPQQFYSLPFLAHKMRLGGIMPIGQDWSPQVIQWFKSAVGNKCLYALVTGEDSNISDSRIPGTLVVRLIDTTGEDDLIVEEYMESQGMAICDPGAN